MGRLLTEKYNVKVLENVKLFHGVVMNIHQNRRQFIASSAAFAEAIAGGAQGYQSQSVQVPSKFPLMVAY